jgi:hypothetical protein
MMMFVVPRAQVMVSEALMERAEEEETGIL